VWHDRRAHKLSFSPGVLVLLPIPGHPFQALLKKTRFNRLKNSDVLSNWYEKLSHLPLQHRKELAKLLKEFNVLFPNTPSRTAAIKLPADSISIE